MDRLSAGYGIRSDHLAQRILKESNWTMTYRFGFDKVQIFILLRIPELSDDGLG